MSDPKSALLNACSDGNVSWLRRVFRTNPQLQPSNWCLKPEMLDLTALSKEAPDLAADLDLPSLEELLECAIIAEQRSVVKFLLTLDPYCTEGEQHPLMRAVLKSPNPDILDLLCKHGDGQFTDSPWDYHYHTFFTLACQELPSDKATPVLHVLLDNGTDITTGLGVGGALRAAIQADQPVGIINKILLRDYVTVSGSDLSRAIQGGNFDVVEAIITKGLNHGSARPNEILQDAKLSGDPDILDLVTTWYNGLRQSPAPSSLVSRVLRPITKLWDLMRGYSRQPSTDGFQVTYQW